MCCETVVCFRFYMLIYIVDIKTQYIVCYRSDMFIHVVDLKTQSIATVPDVLKIIDAKYDYLKDCYAGFAIENVIVSIILFSTHKIRIKKKKKWDKIICWQFAITMCTVFTDLHVPWLLYASNSLYCCVTARVRRYERRHIRACSRCSNCFAHCAVCWLRVSHRCVLLLQTLVVTYL